MKLKQNNTIVRSVKLGTPIQNVRKTITLDSAAAIAAIESLIDSNRIRDLVDSAYVQSRQNYLDSNTISAFIDSAYIQVRDRLRDSLEFLDSAEVIQLIDSAYVQARQDNPFTQLRESNGNIVLSGGFLPDSANVSLGSPTQPFAELHLSSGSVYLGKNKLSVDSDNDFKIETQSGDIANIIVDHVHFGLQKNDLRLDSNGQLIFADKALSTNLGFNLKGNVLADLNGIDLSGLDSSKFLQYNGTDWVVVDIDSAYIQARQNYLDSGTITSFIDSAYVQARQSDFFRDSAFVTDIVDQVYIQTLDRFRDSLEFLDSAEVIQLVDSAYVNARLDTTKFLDSAEAIALTDPLYMDSTEVTTLVDSAYIQERQYYFNNIREDSNGFIRLDNHILPENGKTIYLGSYGNRLGGIFANFGVFGANTVYVGNIGLSESGGTFSITDTQFDSFGFPLPPDSTSTVRKIVTIDPSGNSDFDIKGIIDSTYIDQLIGYKYLDSIEIDSAFIDARVRHLYLDSIEAKTLIDSRVNTSFIDNRVGHLYMDSIEVFTMVDSAYIQARQNYLDSATISAFIDSAYISIRDRFRDSLEFMDSAEVIGLVDSAYIESRIGTTFVQGITTVGAPSDSSFDDGAITSAHPDRLEQGMTVADGLDYLNEVILNVHKNTYVQSVTFTADQTEGGAGLRVTLNLDFEGNADRFDIDWGDGDITENTADTTPSHTYSTNDGSPYTVKVSAKNTQGSGVGSVAEFERQDYIIIFTANPTVSFKAYDNEVDGTEITHWNDGDTVYFENTTTNTNIEGAQIQYVWDWNDGTLNDEVNSDSDAGGVLGPRIAHKFAPQSNTDVKRDVTLTLSIHTTADPSVIPTDDVNQYKIFDIHTIVLSSSSPLVGINKQETSGYNATLVNGTTEVIGSYAEFGNQFKYTFGDGDINLVNVGSGAPGDAGVPITHKYSLSDDDQANGVSQQYTAKLELLSDHTLSPFTSDEFTYTIEPEVRVTLLAEADTVSDGSNDNARTLYDGNDLDLRDRRIINFTADHQNATSFTFSRNGNGIGSGSDATLQFTETSLGTYTAEVDVTGTPGTVLQAADDTVSYQLKPIPGVLNDLSTKTLEWETRTSYRDPHLCSGYSKLPLRNLISDGQNLDDPQYLYYFTGTNASIKTLTDVGGANPGDDLFLKAGTSGFTQSNITFTGFTANDIGTNGTITINAIRDAHQVEASYPSRFYNLFDADILVPRDNIVGAKEWYLSQEIDGDSPGTNGIYAINDNLTDCATVDIGNISEDTPGSIRYASGIKYFNTGGAISVSGSTVSQLTGQAFYGPASRNDVVEIQVYQTFEGSGNPLGTTTKGIGWSQILHDTELDSGIPKPDIGRTEAYALKEYPIQLTGSNVKSRVSLKWRINSPINATDYLGFPQTINMWSGSYTGINELSIPVSSSLGGTYSDNGIRILNFENIQSDTPTYSGSVDYYTDNPYTSSYVATDGHPQALVKYGVIEHDTVNYQNVVPVGPDRSSVNGIQYFTFAFRRSQVANFSIRLNANNGVSAIRIAAPGTSISGWADCSAQYEGAGVPTLNGSNGCASTGGDIIPLNTPVNSTFTMTLGEESLSFATGNVCLVHIGLSSNQTITTLEIGE